MSPTAASIPASEPGPVRWPDRLREMHHVLRSTRANAHRRRALEEAWILLRSALTRFLHHHAAKAGSASPEDLQDICSEKSLDLVRRLESGTWDLTGRSSGEIVGFVSTVARNGLTDLFRDRGRTITEESPEAPDPDVTGAVGEEPEAGVERKAFARALRDCAGDLNPRDRAAWFLRVFYELPSQQIAAHPDVGAKPSHVDVILQRSRKSVGDCLKGKGHDSRTLPSGTFAELWSAFRQERKAVFGGSDAES